MEYAKQIETITADVLDSYFQNEIAPILERYSWVIVWNMGSVSIFNSRGVDMAYTSTVKKLYDKFENEFRYINTFNDCDPLWFLFCCSGTNWNNSPYGKYELSCYDPKKKSY